MADRLAILLDGEFVRRVLRQRLHAFPPVARILVEAQRVAATPELARLELYRIFYYTAEPLGGEATHPLTKATITRNTMASKSAERKEPVTRGTGNVFADLGFPDAAERQAKLRLAYALNQELEARKISQADAAKVLGVTQPKVSALRRYKLEGFSVERLMNLLTALDQDVEIVIRRKPRSRKGGRITVVAA